VNLVKFQIAAFGCIAISPKKQLHASALDVGFHGECRLRIRARFSRLVTSLYTTVSTRPPLQDPTQANGNVGEKTHGHQESSADPIHASLIETMGGITAPMRLLPNNRLAHSTL